MPAKRVKKTAVPPSVGADVDSSVESAKLTLENLAALVKNHHDVLDHNVKAGLIHLPPNTGA